MIQEFSKYMSFYDPCISILYELLLHAIACAHIPLPDMLPGSDLIVDKDLKNIPSDRADNGGGGSSCTIEMRDSWKPAYYSTNSCTTEVAAQ